LWRLSCATSTAASWTSPRSGTGARCFSAGRRARTRSGSGTTWIRAMADATPSEQPRPAPPKLSLGETWRRLNFEQRIAAVGAVLLIVSTLGPFTFVEAAIVLIGAAVLLLLRRRAEGRLFHVPFGDGAVIAAAGTWAGFLILVRLFSRPL